MSPSTCILGFVSTRNPPPASSESVSRRMAHQRTRDTAPELALRRELYRRGHRYRVNVRPDPELRRTADTVFTKRGVAVFVDGCFWHSCPEHGTTPDANRDWWIAKLAATVTRDRNTDRELELRGWIVLRFWEHDHPSLMAEGIEAAVLCADERPQID